MNYQRINNQKMKSINRQNVLNIVRKVGTISRKDLVKKTALTTGTITNLINELIKENYVIEIGSGISDGGRKPVLLQLNPNAGYAVGLELTVSQIVCVLSDFQGKIIRKKSYPTDIHLGKDEVIDKIIFAIEEIISEEGLQKEQVLGIGLAVPGPFDDQKGIMINPPNFKGWEKVPIRDIITKRIGIKTYAEKETHSSALGEYWFGNSAGFHNIFQINVYDIGIGGGFIGEGKLFHGSDCCMEVGHTTVDLDGFVCNCGNKGCLEAQASGNATLQYVKQSLKNGEKSLLNPESDFNLDDVILYAQKGDAVCMNAIDKCAYYLSIALMNVIGMLGPDVIVFGGDFMQRCDQLFNATIQRLENHPYFIRASKVKKIRTTFGNEAGAIGGIATVLNAISEI